MTDGGPGDPGSARNFRSAYYEKLGFSGNEEKNILDLLIASSPFDTDKLSDLCERFDLDRRCVEAWKILLGVDCGRKNPFDEYANVTRVRAEHFQSLKHHLQILLRHNIVIKNRLKQCSNSQTISFDKHSHGGDTDGNHEPENHVKNDGQPNHHRHHHQQTQHQQQQQQNHQLLEENHHQHQGVFISSSDKSDSNHEEPNTTPPANNKVYNDNNSANANISDQIVLNTKRGIEDNPAKLITLMYLLEVGRLESLDIHSQLDSAYCKKLSAMAMFFANVSSDLQEAFFLFRNFIKRLEENEALGSSSADSNKTSPK